MLFSPNWRLQYERLHLVSHHDDFRLPKCRHVCIVTYCCLKYSNVHDNICMYTLLHLLKNPNVLMYAPRSIWSSCGVQAKNALCTLQQCMSVKMHMHAFRNKKRDLKSVWCHANKKHGTIRITLYQQVNLDNVISLWMTILMYIHI